MTQYIIRRLLLMIPTVLLVTIVIFALLRLTPGDPVRDQYGIDLTPQLYQARKHQFGLAAVSTPGFFVSTLLVYFVTFKWRLMPSPRYIPFGQNPLQNLRFIILPAIALSYAAVGGPTRIIRSNVLEVLTEDYIRTAR